MSVRYVEFFDLGSKNSVTYLNDFIKAHSLLEIEPTQFVFDNEGRSSILARVKGSQDDLAKLEREFEECVLTGWAL